MVKKLRSLLFLFCIGFVYILLLQADIPRYDNGNEPKFYHVNKGRLFPIIKAYGEQMSLKECAYTCIQFLTCESINYNNELKLCELCNDVYDEYEAVNNPSERWYNYATPPKQEGGFMQWSQWSTCPERTECDEAIHLRYRTCTNPTPDFGGGDCLGDRFERKICNFPCSSKQNSLNICYSKENPKGYFEAKYTGIIKEIAFYHKNGSIRCCDNPKCLYTYWGCVYKGEDCSKDYCFQIHIFEDETGEKVVPYGLRQNPTNSYNLPLYTEERADKITLKVKQDGYKVTRGKKYYVTLGHYHRYSYDVSYGDGTHCIDVEFIYSSI